MFQLAKETAALAHWPEAERTAALKRILPQSAVKGALSDCGCGRFPCKQMPGWLVVWLVIGLGLFACDCYRQIYRWLRPWQSTGTPGRSTLCMARQRIGIRPVVRLAKTVVRPLAELNAPWAQECFYQGMRLLALDGFVLNLPDTPENAATFGRPGGPGAGAFPQLRVLSLCEAGTHVMLDWLLKPICWGEPSMCLPLLKRLPAGCLLLWDRGFRRWDLVRAVLDRSSHLLARARTDMHLRILRRLGDGSYRAKLYPSRADKKADRNGIAVRVIDYAIDDRARRGGKPVERHRLITTLLDHKKHRAKTLVELYHVRWEEELTIDEIKTHQLSRPTLRSQTPAGVVQEVWGLLLAHFVVRNLMCQAAAQAGVPPVRLSFTATLKILQCRLSQCPPPGPRRSAWWKALVQEVAQETLEPRRDRINPRVVRVRLSKWPRKRKKHYDYPQPRKKFRDSIAIYR
jgi:Transposase DDE domain/Insertion element 4 transposase N-terminal